MVNAGWYGKESMALAGDWFGLHALHTAGGYTGLACACFAAYLSAAEVINADYGRVVLPIGARGS
jgi:succinate-acetate transporter protein